MKNDECSCSVFKIKWCEAMSYTLKIEKCTSAKKSTLYVVDFKQCDDFSDNIKFHSADQHLL